MPSSVDASNAALACSRISSSHAFASSLVAIAGPVANGRVNFRLAESKVALAEFPKRDSLICSPDFREASARGLVRALEKAGFDVIRQKGSHMILHNPEIDKWTLVAMQV